MLDVNRLAQALLPFLSELQKRGIALHAVEVGNEFNWMPFNGDLQYLPGGAVLNDRSLREFSFGDAVRRGFEKVAQAARVVRSSLQKVYGVNRVPVVLGGLQSRRLGGCGL